MKVLSENNKANVYNRRGLYIKPDVIKGVCQHNTIKKHGKVHKCTNCGVIVISTINYVDWHQSGKMLRIK